MSAFYQFDQRLHDDDTFTRMEKLANVHKRGGRVVFVDTGEASLDINKKRGMGHPGWYWVQHIDTTKGLRFRSEPLCLSSNVFGARFNSGNTGEAIRSGQSLKKADDQYVSDSTHTISVDPHKYDVGIGGDLINEQGFRQVSIRLDRANAGISVGDYVQLIGINEPLLNDVFRVTLVLTNFGENDTITVLHAKDGVHDGIIYETNGIVRRLGSDFDAPLYWKSTDNYVSYGNLNVAFKLVDGSLPEIKKKFSDRLATYTNDGAEVADATIYTYTVQERKINKSGGRPSKWTTYTPSQLGDPSADAFNKTAQSRLTGDSRFSINGVLRNPKDIRGYNYQYRVIAENTSVTDRYITEHMPLVSGEQTLVAYMYVPSRIVAADTLASKKLIARYEIKGSGTGPINLQLQTKSSVDEPWENNGDLVEKTGVTKVSNFSTDIDSISTTHEFTLDLGSDTTYANANGIRCRVIASLPDSIDEPYRYEEFASFASPLVVG